MLCKDFRARGSDVCRLSDLLRPLSVCLSGGRQALNARTAVISVVHSKRKPFSGKAPVFTLLKREAQIDSTELYGRRAGLNHDLCIVPVLFRLSEIHGIIHMHA